MNRTLSFWGGAVILFASFPLSADAQVNEFPGSSTIVTPGATITIDGGDNPSGQGNLFHSFTEFNPGNTPVRFNNAGNVQRIFGRVINGTTSWINSTISANSTPVQIFLINPAGIRLGQNAQLATDVSFVGSTATQVQFPDDVFDASDTSLGGTLSVQIPTALRFTGTPGQIRIEGTGHTLTGSLHDELDSATTTGIQSSANQTIALIGGGVQLQGGNVRTDQGRIEIGSVAAGATVSLSSDLLFDYSAVQDFLDIELTGRASIDASGAAGGSINVQGRRVSLEDGSVILSITQGAGAGQDIAVTASETIQLTGFNNLRPTLIATKSGFSAAATGSSGDISLSAPQVNLQSGAQVLTGSFFSGDRPGNITVNANTLEIGGIGVTFTGPSGLYAKADNANQGGTITVNGVDLFVRDRGTIVAQTTDVGTAGNIDLDLTDSVTIQSGGTVSASTSFSTGQAGNAVIKTKNLTLNEGRILSNSLGSGNAGRVEVIADQITLSNRSEIATTAFLSGDAGTVRLNANQISLNDVSRITSQIDSSATGSAGNVEISTGQLQVLGGSQISAGVFGTGTGGNVDITASDSIQIMGEGVDGSDVVQSGISTQVNVGAAGQGGQLTVRAANLFLSDGGNLTAGTAGNGVGGSLIVEVDDTITVQGEGSLLPSAIAARTRTDQDAGNLAIRATTLQVSDRGTVTVAGFNENGPSGNAGNLNINARYIRLNNQGSITGSTTSGQGGNLDLDAMHIILLFESEISTTAGTAGQPGDGGNITIDAATVTGLFNSDIASNAFQGRGGRIVITAQGIFGLEFRLARTADNDITAFSQTNPQLNGEVVLNTPEIDPTQALIEVPVVESPEVVERVCQVGVGRGLGGDGTLRVQGRALPSSPSDAPGVGRILLRELEITEEMSGGRSDRPPTPSTNQPPTPQRNARDRLIAQGIGQNTQGQLALTAQIAAPTVLPVLISAVQC